MPATIELDDADKAALVVLLKQAIAADPFPMSHRTRLWQGILAKLNPPPATDPSHRRAGKRHQPPSGCHRMYVGEWWVQWFDYDGDCEVAIFSGPKARERAIQYAERQLLEELRFDP